MSRTHAAVDIPVSHLVLLAAMVALGATLFLPGVSGPYVFDDYSNLLDNSYVQLTTLDAESLYRSAFSIGSGPLRRPVSMLSFAFNFYFAGGFGDSTPFKLTNILIHLCNGLLMFWLVRLILRRYVEMQAGVPRRSLIRPRTYTYVAAAIALFWVTHPIHISSVLYLVQRMTALSAFFTLGALICYLTGRRRVLLNQRGGHALIFLGVPLLGVLGIFSKEIAALLPVFLLVLELTLFPTEWPWHRWRRLPLATKRAIGIAAVAVAAAMFVGAVLYAMPNYAFRNFTMMERLMTDGRVLMTYLALILVPRINEFSLFHDEFEISRSLTTPWTTAPAIIAILLLTAVAIRSRRSSPLLSFGILWFFAAHLLESSIFPLEIIHEHRNYLATLGPLIAVVHVIDRGSLRLGHNRLWLLLPTMIIVFSAVTFIRAGQWSSFHNLFHYEVSHNPKSASTHAGMGVVLMEQRKYDDAMKEFRRAAELRPQEASYLLTMHMFSARAGKRLDAADYQETARRLAEGGITATTGQALQYVSDCILTWCRSLNASFETWLNTLINRTSNPNRDTSYYYYLLGRTLFSQGKAIESIRAYERSYEQDRKYLHPLFDLAYVYIRLYEPELAEDTLNRLRAANRITLHPRAREIDKLQQDVDELQELLASSKRKQKPR